MKKLFIYLVFLLGSSLQAQYFNYYFFSVPSGEGSEYETIEKEYFAKVMSKAVEEGIINGWSVYRKVGGDRKSINYYSWVGIGNLEAFKAFLENIGNAFSKARETLDSPGLVDIGRKKFGSYMEWSGTFYREGMAQPKDFNGFKYLRHNYAMVPNPNAFAKAQNDVWKPFIQKHMNSQKIKQQIWAVARRLNPVGNAFNWNVMTIDGYNELTDVYAPSDGDYPDISNLDLDAIDETMPYGWYKRIIWQRIVWVDEEGKIHLN